MPHDLLMELAQIVAMVLAASDPPKDVWDKLSAISGLVAGILVALIGAVATYIYNQRQQQATAADAELQRSAEDVRAERQLAVLRVQTIEAFFPHLKSTDERDREAALVAIDALGDHELAAQLAVYYGGEAAVGALARIATTGDEESTVRAIESLEAVLGALRASVVQVLVDGLFRETGFVVRGDGIVVTANLLGEDVSGVEARLTNGETRPASIIFTGDRPPYDVLVLKIAGDRLSWLPVSTSSPVVGDPVVTLAFGAHVGPDGAVADQIPPGESVIVGSVSAVSPGSSSTTGEIQARMRTEGGFAGAPLVNQRGQVVGIHVGGRLDVDGTTTAFAIPATALSEPLLVVSAT
jgi:S1-C subfamily serine protease